MPIQVVFDWTVMKYYAIIDQSKRFKYDSVLQKRILNKGLEGERELSRSPAGGGVQVCCCR